MSIAPGNPDRLLVALDEHLDHTVRLVIYGRAAVWLGFDGVPPEVGRTRDVDGILSEDDVAALNTDMQFWDARDAVHERFQNEGLYITHLFPAKEVFLRRNWLEQIIPVSRLRLRHLKLFRPATLDLVLTKMMRGNDPQDMADAKFMIEHDKISKKQLEAAFAEMNPVELVELRDAFLRAKPIVIGFAAP
jgi:hypothetical protein